MLPTKKYSQNIYIEITNLPHGGAGWELGTCLWSPVYNTNRRTKTWKLMEKVKTDDIIVHLVKINDLYHFYGISKVSSPLVITENKPAHSGNWLPPYQRIALDSFNPLDQPYSVTEIFKEYESELKNILKKSSSSFYVEYGKTKELRMAQKYFTTCSDDMYDVFNSISDKIEFKPVLNDIDIITIPTLNEPQYPDYNPPSRVSTIVSRIIRDTNLSRQVKSENSWKCQICDLSIKLNNGNNYSEGHHLKPLGGTYQGPDIKGNIIIVCPTHHTELDYGVIAINPVTSIIEHIDKDNPFHGKYLAYKREDLDSEFLKFHYDHRFKNDSPTR